jgi:hypothetical protein
MIIEIYYIIRDRVLIYREKINQHIAFKPKVHVHLFFLAGTPGRMTMRRVGSVCVVGASLFWAHGQAGA